MKYVLAVLACVLLYAAYGVAQDIIWPRQTELIRAIDSEPAKVLQWMEDNLKPEQCAAFVDYMVPVTDEIRAEQLEKAKSIVEEYADTDTAETVKATLDARIGVLKPVADEPIEKEKTDGR